MLNQVFPSYAKATDFTFAGMGKIKGKLCSKFVSKKSLTITNIIDRCGPALNTKKNQPRLAQN